MAAKNNFSDAPPAWPSWRVALAGLATLGLALSALLSWHQISGGSVIGCTPGGPCDQVLSSRWSTVGGVLPVSGLATGTYLALLVAIFSIGPTADPGVRRLAWQAMLILTGAIVGSAAWFLIVQRWMVGAFCPYCVTTHAVGTLLAALVLWQSRTQIAISRHELPAGAAVGPQSGSPASATVLSGFGLSGLGVALAGVLVACQILIVPSAVYHGGKVEKNLSPIDPRSAPLAGSADARYIVDVLFDYQCPHCQRLHFLLDEAVRRYDGKLAFVLCPTPLSNQCNPYVTRDTDEFKDSCELAKIALAVWMAKPTAFPEFDRWMFSHETGDFWHPRHLDAARRKAIELVGSAKFEAARRAPWIDRYLQTTTRIYGDTVQGSSAVPKLVFGSHWTVPEPRDADDLVAMLQDSLGVPKP